MSQSRVIVVLIGLMLLNPVVYCQTTPNGNERTTADATVDLVMQRALARCRMEENGVKRIQWVSPTPNDFKEIKELGESAVGPLSRYLSGTHSGFGELMAVKFLIALGGTATMAPLEKATMPDQWDVTRAQALSGLYQLSANEAKPYIEAAVNDKSQLVRQRAHDLYQLYPASK